MEKTVRINKALADAGVCSRRRADELIALGNGASDVEARKGYYRELIEIYMEDVPSVAMYAVINAIAHSNQLVMEDANRYEMARVHWAE